MLNRLNQNEDASNNGSDLIAHIFTHYGSGISNNVSDQRLIKNLKDRNVKVKFSSEFIK